MRVPLSWLGELVDLPETDALVDRLTFGGLEVEDVERVGPDLSGLRVGLVLECAPHPNADRLRLCRVDLGEGEPVDIVCGAPNVAAGQKVAVAPPGTRLPDGTKLKRARIRGVVSNGMICSARELGLGDDAGGILVLDAHAPVGAPLASVLPAGDTVIEVALTPNRGDCASVLGIAREVRAYFGGPLRMPPLEPPETGAPASDSVRVAIDDAEGCHAYVARIVRSVRVGPSPEWAQRRLALAGVRAINNVVDATNLVMLELGQPLHGFDLATLRGAAIHVRRARAGEKLVTLDGETRTLANEDLVIADAERAIAVAGVMGGAETEVGAATRDVLIESAHFHPTRVRRTARRLGLQTEASYRFERGIDRAGVRRAADRAARLMAEWADGQVAPGAIEARGSEPAATDRIELEAGRVNRLLGTQLDAATIESLLARVEVGVEERAGERLRCRIPTHRNDLHIPEDLVEEVARIHGYARIPATAPEGALRAPHRPREWDLTLRAQDALRGQGLLETMSFPFLAASDLDHLRLPGDDPRRATVRVRNPLVEQESHLRPSLVPALLHAVGRNRSRQVDRVRLFEVARVFLGRAQEPLPEERWHVGAVLTPGEERRLWDPREPVPLLFEAKGLAARLLRELGYEPAFSPEAPEPFLHPGAALGLRVGRRAVGAVGELHPECAAHFDLEPACALVLLDLSTLTGIEPTPRRYREVSRQPRVRRDLAVLVPREQPAGALLEAIRRHAGPHLVSVELFDRYEGAGVPEGRVSLAFRLVFERSDRALVDAEVSRAVDRVVAALSEQFGAELR